MRNDFVSHQLPSNHIAQGSVLDDSQAQIPVVLPAPGGLTSVSPGTAKDHAKFPESRQDVLRHEHLATKLPSPSKVRVWGTDFAKLTMSETIILADQIIRRRVPEYFVTANVNYLMLMDDFPQLAEVNQHAVAILADGQPIVTRSRLGHNPLPGRVAGADLVVELARYSAQSGHRVFFLGGAGGVAERAATELKRRFPGLQVAGCLAPPFRSLTSAEHHELLQRIRSSRADILLVAFGQPKGELWIYDNYRGLDIPLSVQIGASLDFLAGTARRAPRIWQSLGLEWLYRACHDPRRLIPRYARNAAFVIRQCLPITN